jgi:hypothetical protein
LRKWGDPDPAPGRSMWVRVYSPDEMNLAGTDDGVIDLWMDPRNVQDETPSRPVEDFVGRFALGPGVGAFRISKEVPPTT